MRKRFLIPVALLMMIALGLGAGFVLVRRHALAGSKGKLSSAEYDVLSAWITAKAKEQPDKRARKVIIFNTTQFYELQNHLGANGQPIPWAETAKSLQDEAPSLQAKTIEAFRTANEREAILTPSFHVAIEYGLADSAQLDPIFKKGGGSWPAYYKQFPGSQGILTFARVGLNPDGTQALLYWNNICGGLCGGNAYTVMEKRNGQWIIVADVQQYVY